eukprot:2431125-Pyramimonas_sp.AAC.1
MGTGSWRRHRRSAPPAQAQSTLPKVPDTHPGMAPSGQRGRARRDDKLHPLEAKARPKRQEVRRQLGDRFGN